ncbi:MAG: hypothetical protein ACRD3W_02305, partial [Terriglobales bacterium]
MIGKARCLLIAVIVLVAGFLPAPAWANPLFRRQYDATVQELQCGGSTTNWFTEPADRANRD